MSPNQNLQTADVTDLPELTLSERFFEFIDDNTFPCVGAKAALANDSIEAHEFDKLGTHENDQRIVDGLSRFVQMLDTLDDDSMEVHSYVALFDGPFDMNEHEFEAQLWAQLWRLHKLDIKAGNKPANDVSSDTNNPRFSMSLSGHPFFIIGLHPHASRMARRFSHPAMVFNSHRQFDRLRKDGRFEKMQEATRSRDKELQGSINPNLANFGEASEARQYSGRKVEDQWQCPYDFRRNNE
ncbi:guanitoxin biosynthesis heme-dependent pre-guanitoxin N-hydroxylase GntA [Methylophaga pinxianii]|uniref:guanitoxin biosynthesis heme-dependent pre-guanitoxin N-hydroxylase GntA n=1 Tax=Methylophaga pinxianii TaxID=2881052 RepID=UPI001CF176D4|nr:guanitoxin biosynthesis heme-dependent pre-guanitoxin N-hydroxylase GntA [Methylophaga pinxianii]MCB2425480.1 YqcI/YcgG family protein [Methylophaga pinxianii]UPH44699.1 YqcI/YcgG family protein [Methylophaga pinxianii]